MIYPLQFKLKFLISYSELELGNNWVSNEFTGAPCPTIWSSPLPDLLYFAFQDYTYALGIFFPQSCQLKGDQYLMRNLFQLKRNSATA